MFSLSTFIINASLPKILEINTFNDFVYLFQMILFLTTICQFGIVISLYKYIAECKDSALNAFYVIISFINSFLIGLGLINNNFISELLKLGPLSLSEHFIFYLSVVVSSIFLYNKGKNIAEHSYKYMLKISLSVFVLRIFSLMIISTFKINRLELLMLLLFVFPFIFDIVDYVKKSCRFWNLISVNIPLIKRFLIYSFKVWVISTLFLVTDRIFLIATKNVDPIFTTAIAFSSGFVGIIALFNTSLNNYFLSSFTTEKISEIKMYVKKLKRYFICYFPILLLICFSFALFFHVFYPTLGKNAVYVLFITLFRSGLLSYLGMFALLTKPLNLINIEIALNILRLIVTCLLCLCWHPDSLLVWYAVVMFTIPFPELILSVWVNSKLKKYDDQLGH